MNFTCKDFPGLIMHKWERVVSDDKTSLRCKCNGKVDADFYSVGDICEICNTPYKYAKTWFTRCTVCGRSK